MKFRVMIVKKNGQPVGVRAGAINGRVIVLALRDEPEQMNWYDAVKLGIPSKEEWMAIAENLDAVNKALSCGRRAVEKKLVLVFVGVLQILRVVLYPRLQ